MPCIPESTFMQTVNAYAAKANDTAAQKVILRDSEIGLQQGGLQEWILPDLAAIGPASNVDQNRYESSGTWLYLAKSGTSPGAEFTIEFAGAKSVTKIVAGTRITGNFKGFNVTRTGAASGSARFVIGQRSDVGYTEDTILVTGNFAAQKMSSPGYNAAVFGTSAPTTDIGIATFGATAARAYLTSGNGNILGGTFQWWVRDIQANSAFNSIVATPPTTWFVTNNSEPIKTGNARAASSDFAIGIRTGYVWCEVLGVTTSGGAGPLYLVIEVL